MDLRNTNYMKPFGYLFILLLGITSCTKDVDPVNTKPMAGFSISDNIDHLLLIDQSQDMDGDSLNRNWISMCETIQINNNTSNPAYVTIPDLLVENQFQVKLIISDGLHSDSVTKDVKLPETTEIRRYGLGITLNSEQSNNTDYSWYYDQMNTGTYSDVNCGPASVTMAIKWANPSFTKTPLDARNTYRSTGGWWYTNDITNYLNKYAITNYTVSVSSIDAIQSELTLGHIVILCLDMYYIRSQTKDKWHVDKFYPASTTGWGHFIVVKGFKMVDGEAFYEVYDPYSFGKTYTDGTLKGKDRYYQSADLNKAVINWWNYAIVVSKNSLKSTNQPVDIRAIIHKPGL